LGTIIKAPPKYFDALGIVWLEAEDYNKSMQKRTSQVFYIVGLTTPVFALLGFGFLIRPLHTPTLVMESVTTERPKANSKYTTVEVTAIVQYNAPTLLKRYMAAKPQLGTGPTTITDAKGKDQGISYSEGLVYRTKSGSDQATSPSPAASGAARFELNWEIDTAQCPSPGALILHSQINADGKSLPFTAILRENS